MTWHALRILQEAAKMADAVPMEPTPAVQLALSWLVMRGIAEEWQVGPFWKGLTEAPEPGNEHIGNDIRTRDMSISIRRWCYVAWEKGEIRRRLDLE